MKALGLIDPISDWDTTGYNLFDAPDPILDEKNNYDDLESVIVETSHAGFCGTDRSIWHRGSFKDRIQDSLKSEKKRNRIAGHEFYGRVVEMGTLAKQQSGLKIGEAVAAESHLYCGRCYQCLSGDYHVCTNDKIIGISVDGCFAKYVKLPYKVLWPTDISLIHPEVAAIQEPFGNAVWACQKTDLRGKNVAIMGCGTIGLFSVIVAKALGAGKVIGVDVDPESLKRATKLGADEVIQAEIQDKKDFKSQPKVVQAIRDYTKGEGVDAAIEMSGFNNSLNSAIQSVRNGGNVVLFGIKDHDFVIQGYEKMIMKGIALHCVVGRQLFQTWMTTRNLLESKTNGIQKKIRDVILSPSQDTIIPINQFDKADFEDRMQKYPKLVLKFD